MFGLAKTIQKAFDYLIVSFDGVAASAYVYGSSLYDSCARHAIGLLSNSSMVFGSATVDALKRITTTFAILGELILAMCFYIGLMKTAQSERQFMRVEVLVPRLIGLAIAATAVSNAFPIMQYVDSLGSSLVIVVTSETASSAGAVSGNAGGAYLIGGETGDYSKGETYIMEQLCDKDTDDNYVPKETLSMPFGTAIIAIFFGVVYIGGMFAAGLILVYSAYTRFFKILISIPYAGLAFGTLFLGPPYDRISESYIKTVVAYQLSAVTMCMSLVLVGILLSGTNTPALFASGVLPGHITFLVEKLLVCFIGTGLVKSSEQMTERMLGLH